MEKLPEKAGLRRVRPGIGRLASKRGPYERKVEKAGFGPKREA